MWSARLDDAEAGSKLPGEISVTHYIDDPSLIAESEEELKSLLMKVKEESEKAGLNLSIKKMKIMASGPIISWQIDGEQWKLWQTSFCQRVRYDWVTDLNWTEKMPS